MVNTFLKTFQLLHSNLKIINIRNSFSSLEYSDIILNLTEPKLLDFINLTSAHSSSVVKVKNIASDIIDTKTTSSHKFDKKYKNNSHVQDITEIKKNKNKLIKKKRKNSNDIDNEEIFVDTQNSLLSQEPLIVSSLKSPKPNSRYKKKQKLKTEPLEIDNNLSNILDSSNNEVLNDGLSKDILFYHPVSLQELSIKMDIPEAEIITYLFLNKSISATRNQVLDFSMASNIAKQYGFQLLKLDREHASSNKILQPIVDQSHQAQRSPVITILGHVDHGKTTLLDSILKTNLAQKEYGGITQAISGYEIEWCSNSKTYKLMFLDTPGHESFKSMRLRSAQVTDIVLLVIAADDGLKPQTVESINYIKEMALSFIVVITKVDKALDNIEKIKQDLSSYGLLTQESGGDTIIVEVSAAVDKNIDLLLSKICIFSEAKNLVANFNQLANGTILEAYLDKKQGPVANLIVQNGSIKLGNLIATANVLGKVKSITSLSNNRVSSSGPSSIVQILGFTAVPQAGLSFQVLNNEKEAKNYCLKYSNNENFNKSLKLLNTRISLDTNAGVKQFKLILKTDTQGSLEAIIDLLFNIAQSKVQINLISANVGDITYTDIELANTTNAAILAFNLNSSFQVNNLVKKHKIIFKSFNIIYDLFDYVKKTMLDLIEPEYDRIFIGHAYVQTVFNMNKGFVAGCLVDEGKLTRMCYIKVSRKGNLVYEGFITSLKRMKNDVDEIVAINECGLMSDYKLWEQSDTIDAYELVSKEKTL